MTVKSFPSLDITGTIFDKFIPATIARVAATIATTARGIAGGVAPLDSTSRLPIANAAAGTVLFAMYNQATSTFPPRPTARTDIAVWWVSPTGIANPPDFNAAAGDLRATWTP